MKEKELKKLSEAEAAEKTQQIKLELMKLNSQVSTGTAIKNPYQIKKLKRTIARLLTYKKIKN
ncbi:MAG: 50S ribosomal protein L29 [Candidatus Woesearchaeota archaeon]